MKFPFCWVPENYIKNSLWKRETETERDREREREMKRYRYRAVYQPANILFISLFTQCNKKEKSQFSLLYKIVEV